MAVANNNLQSTQIVPPDSSSKVFDDACGIGTVTVEIKKHFPEIPVLAIDSSAGMLEVFNRKVKKHEFKNVEARLLDGGKLTGMLHLRNTQLYFPLRSSPSPLTFFVQIGSPLRPEGLKLTHPRRPLRQHYTRVCLHRHRLSPQRFRHYQRTPPRHSTWRDPSHQHVG